MYQTILVPIDLSEETLTQKVFPHINALSQTDNPDFYFISAIYAPSFSLLAKLSILNSQFAMTMKLCSKRYKPYKV